MTRHLLIVGAAAAALALGACNPKPAETTAVEGAMPDANAAATVPTPANEAAAPDFVTKAANSDAFEIAAAKVALEKSTNNDVRAFAQSMIDGHTASTADLKKAITESGLTLTVPTVMPDDMQGKIDDLKTAEVDDFDKAYIDGQVDAHQDALNLMQRYAEDGDVPALKTFATTVGAAVQTHFDKAKAIKEALG